MKFLKIYIFKKMLKLIKRHYFYNLIFGEEWKVRERERARANVYVYVYACARTLCIVS